MDILRPDQILTLGLFLGLLGLLWLVVKLKAPGILKTPGISRFANGGRIRVTDAAALGPQDRALILAVDGREFLVLRSRGAAPVVLPLEARP
ncbi:flagellar assembly protein FliO [Cereibacter sphaeroides]|uniref:flagellar assembly protein FliO n=1 Tax=Cereibacter sphaeroides TaxID=1063 RepID=UPI001F422F5E|nr:flagellar assembly protein FliO [Cereibacter sphaeroides]MCE6961910.1 flagellar assembly protein FliO [Cereibacter sphaeroides]MCE6970685.1 flagellar assembly protein FliO [Cereibacter sphaeroides]MCE6975719.1 flagellar assembly protein FliO [Cereibacter sphaeroides]